MVKEKMKKELFELMFPSNGVASSKSESRASLDKVVSLMIRTVPSHEDLREGAVYFKRNRHGAYGITLYRPRR